MKILTKEHLREIKESIRHRSRLDEVQSKLQQFLEIKEKLFWKCDSPGGCACGYSLSAELLRQVNLFEGILYDLDVNEIQRAIQKLDWYEENIKLPENESEVNLIMMQMVQDEQTVFRDAETEIEKMEAFETYLFTKYTK